MTTRVARLTKNGILNAKLFDELSDSNREIGVDRNGTFYAQLIDENLKTNLSPNVPMRMTSDRELIVYDYINEFVPYPIISETRLPIYGTGGGAYPPTSQWTGLLNQSRDDFFLSIDLPFVFYIAGSGYTRTFLGSNTYLTFGSGSTDFISLSESNPPYPKFHFGSADNSVQRVSTFVSSNNYVRIRYEGTASTFGTVGSPNIVLEITLFNPLLTESDNVLELRVGNHSRPNGQKMVASSTTAYATYSHSTNQSYVFVGNANGTEWNILEGHSVLY
jgi:hypothetical protein